MTRPSFRHLFWLLLPLLLGACQSGTKSPAETQTTAVAPAAPPKDMFTIKHPAWAATATLYQVNVRQYTPEGTFRAFEPHLPRLQKMGVGILWLMPINPIGVSHRKGTLGSAYSVRDYRAVNPDLGTLADLQHLVNEAHRLSMHVILDWVANHSSWDNALTTQHPDWYTRDSLGHFRPPVADWQDVIDLDYRQPALRQYMTESMVYWVKNADIDGFRADVAGLVPTDFWNDTRRELERIKPVFMLAEWDELFPPTFLKEGEFTPNTHLLEKAFDATYALHLHGLLDSLGRGQKPTTELAHYLAAERQMYPPGTHLMTFTSTHDINAWDGSEYERLGANAQPMAVLAALWPGIPMLYNGQEAALKKRLRFFDKDTIPWNGYPLQGFYTTLLQLKKRHPALRNFDASSAFRLLPSPAQTVLFDRRKNTEAVVVALNLSDKPQGIELPKIPDSRGGHYRTVLSFATDTAGPKDDVKPIVLPPHGFQVWEQTGL
ncbi:alpha-amylase family glycosyl hydrolase [Hymenobacter terrenus]|uniref:alpha-amylase family glycosyl hydrolase n=1 Tax=Hymenobacter terrenus TaxID=1629124 RepID=UPI0006962B62|nr:alpha-amylase family glycosyl hydrolase [Hymenobacter terrenus]